MENLQLAINDLNAALADIGADTVVQAEPSGWTQLSFWFCVAAYTVMLLVIIRMIHSDLKNAGNLLAGLRDGGGERGDAPVPPVSLLMRIQVKSTLDADGKPVRSAKPGKEVEVDTGEIFSRTAGAIGAGGLAAIFVTLGYWIIYALHFDAAAIDHLNGLSSYFMLGAALFAPYAIDKIKEIFK